MIVLDFNIALAEIKSIIISSKNIVLDVVDYLYKTFEKYNWIGIYIHQIYCLEEFDQKTRRLFVNQNTINEKEAISNYQSITGDSYIFPIP